ncbi:MAG: hypothetical protein ACREO1_00970, partial [Arenimonas sp.]
ANAVNANDSINSVASQSGAARLMMDTNCMGNSSDERRAPDRPHAGIDRILPNANIRQAQLKIEV